MIDAGSINKLTSVKDRTKLTDDENNPLIQRKIYYGRQWNQNLINTLHNQSVRRDAIDRDLS